MSRVVISAAHNDTDLVAAVENYLDELDERWQNDTITVVIPEFVMGKLYDVRNLLHNQSALALKAALLNREGTVVTSVPYHVDGYGMTAGTRSSVPETVVATGPLASAKGKAAPSANGDAPPGAVCADNPFTRPRS